MGFIYAIIASLLWAVNDVVRKKIVSKISAYIILWAGAFFSLPFFVYLVYRQGVPSLDKEFFIFATINALFLPFTYVLYLKAIKISPLSLTIPFLAFTPACLLLTSYIALGEVPSLLGLFGIILIIFGAYMLNCDQFKYGYLAPFKAITKEKGSLYMLLVAFLWSIGASLDKLSIIHSSPLFYSTYFELLFAIIFFVILLVKKDELRNLVKLENKDWGILAGIGVIIFASILLQMMSAELILVNYTISIKRAGLIFAIFFGWLFFKERVRSRLFGAFFMLLGVLLIVLGG